MVDIVLASFLAGSDGGECLKQTAPITLGIVNAPHFFASNPVTFKMTMLQFNASLTLTFSNKADFDLRIQRRIVFPVRAHIPSEYQTRRWFPSDYATPLTGASVFSALEPSPSDTRLDHGINCLRASDLVMCKRPPRGHFFREDSPRYVLCGLNVDCLRDLVGV